MLIQYSTTLAIILNGTTPLPNLKKCKPQTAISAMQARQSKTVLRDHRTRKLVCIISIDSLRFLFLQTTGMLQEDSRMHAPALFANYFPLPARSEAHPASQSHYHKSESDLLPSCTSRIPHDILQPLQASYAKVEGFGEWCLGSRVWD